MRDGFNAPPRKLWGVFFGVRPRQVGTERWANIGAMSPSLKAFLLFRYAQFLTIFGLRARAHEFIELTLQQNPRHQRAWTFSAFLNAEKGRMDAAVRDFEQAVALKPDDADSLFNLGFILQRTGKHPEALERFERATELNGFLDRAWYGTGISLVKLGRYEEAAPKFAEAARLQPMNPYAAYQLAGCWFHLGQRDKLEAEYERVRGFDPKIAAQMQRDFGAGQPAR